MNETFAKLIAISIVGSVAKSLFGQPFVRPASIGQATAAANDLIEKVKS